MPAEGSASRGTLSADRQPSTPSTATPSCCTGEIVADTERINSNVHAVSLFCRQSPGGEARFDNAAAAAEGSSSLLADFCLALAPPPIGVESSSAARSRSAVESAPVVVQTS